jgi:hypothetical protein
LEQEEGETLTENKWIQYKLDQNNEVENTIKLLTQNGVTQTQ